MRTIVAVAVALLLGAACDMGEEVSPDTSSPTADSGAMSDIAPDVTVPDAGPQEDMGVVTTTPDPRLKDGVWCPTEGCLLRFRGGKWDCDPGLAGGSADYMSAMCWPDGQ